MTCGDSDGLDNFVGKLFLQEFFRFGAFHAADLHATDHGAAGHGALAEKIIDTVTSAQKHKKPKQYAAEESGRHIA